MPLAMTTSVLLVLLALVGSSLAASLPYVIGGDSVTSSSTWPWQGSLQFSSGSHTCGCSLISRTWALTAAHCVAGSGYRVRFGSYIRTSGGQLRTVAQIIVHERYGSGAGAYPNDIALLRFAAVSYNINVKAITMATTEQAGNPNCWITGWGHTVVGYEHYKVLPTVLQQGHVDVYTNAYCKQRWGSNINDGHVCVGKQNKIGACQGDSGGPAVCKVGGSYHLIGVTSWVASGCGTNLPSAYTRVSYFRTWVRGKTGI